MAIKIKDIFEEYNAFKSNANISVFKMLIDAITSMFKWENLPNTIRPEYIEMYLRMYGKCAIVPDKYGNLIVAIVNMGGAPDVYGIGTTPIISTLNGYTETYDDCVNDVIYGDNGRRGVIIYNNNTKTPDSILYTFSEHLNEAITSLFQNIIHSRYNPVFVANSDIVKRAVENAMKDIIAGKPVVIASENILQEFETGTKTLESVKITDVDKQDKIQFITKTIDDLLRWFCSLYGQAIQGNGKLAQQTVDEVNGTTSASFIIPEMNFRCRQKAVDLINSTFGLNCSISYNKPWAVEVEKYTEDIERTENVESGVNENETENNVE